MQLSSIHGCRSLSLSQEAVGRQRISPSGNAMVRGFVVVAAALLAAVGPHHAAAHGSLEATSPETPTLAPEVIEK